MEVVCDLDGPGGLHLLISAVGGKSHSSKLVANERNSSILQKQTQLVYSNLSLARTSDNLDLTVLVLTLTPSDDWLTLHSDAKLNCQLYIYVCMSQRRARYGIWQMVNNAPIIFQISFNFISHIHHIPRT